MFSALPPLLPWHNRTVSTELFIMRMLDLVLTWPDLDAERSGKQRQRHWKAGGLICAEWKLV